MNNVRARWLINFKVTARTSICLNGGTGADEPAEWQQNIHGTQVAGALREALCQRVVGHLADEPTANEARNYRFATGLHVLLGGPAGDSDGDQSQLIVDDWIATKLTLEIREGVTLDDRGHAVDGGLFTHRVWAPGSTWEGNLELVINADDPAPEEELLALLSAALDAFDNDDIWIGQRGSRGWGRLSISEVSAQRFELGDSADGWEKWFDHQLGGTEGSPRLERFARLEAAVERGLPSDRFGSWSELLDEVAGCRANQIVFGIPIVFDGGVIQGSVNAAIGPDTAHIRSGGQDILSGPGIGGALRASARSLTATTAVEALFGSDVNTGDTELHGSPLVIEEPRVNGKDATRLVETRIMIDSASSAPIDGALFDEEVLHGAEAELSLRLRLPNAESDDALPYDSVIARALLVHVVASILNGEISLGADRGIGRGWVRAHPQRPMWFDIGQGDLIPEKGAELLNQWAAQLTGEAAAT